jgi:solute carrier family 25 S-adenosylmethionine transporter 26
MQLPFTSIQFPLYEGLKSQMSKRFLDGKRPSPAQAAICGMFAGGVAALTTTPLDVVKTRVMLEARVRKSNGGTLMPDYGFGYCKVAFCSFIPS